VAFTHTTRASAQCRCARVVTITVPGAARVVADYFRTLSPRFTSPSRHSSAETALVAR
jgi:hypothetical protein